MRNAGTAWLVFAILLGGDEGRLNSASSSVFGSDSFVASAGVGHKKESSFQPFGKASVSAVRFTEIAAGQHSWSSRFRCAETTWFSYWAAQEYAPCNSTTGPSSITQAAAGGQFSCYLHGGNPIDDTTKSPWFCTGRNVQVNYKAIDFNSIRYDKATFAATYRLPQNFVSAKCDLLEDPHSAKVKKVMGGSSDAKGPSPQTMHFLLPGGVRLEKKNASGASQQECTRHVHGRTAVFVVRNAVKNWFHASYNLVDVLLAMLAAGVYRPGAPPVDIILLPPDKALAGNTGNQIDILRAFADGGSVSLASEYQDEVVCYESAVFALTGLNALQRRETFLTKFGDMGNKACPNVFPSLAPSLANQRMLEATGVTPKPHPSAGANFGKIPAAGNVLPPSTKRGTLQPNRVRTAAYDVLNGIVRRHLGLSTTVHPSNASSPASLVVTLLVRGKQQDGYQKKIRRQFFNAEEIADALKRLPGVVLQVADLQLLTFTEQIKLLSSTALLVGMHGAGLTNALFMLPGNAVLEILPGSFSSQMLAQTLFKDISNDAGLVYSTMITAENDCDESDSCTVSAIELIKKAESMLKGVSELRRKASYFGVNDGRNGGGGGSSSSNGGGGGGGSSSNRHDGVTVLQKVVVHTVDGNPAACTDPLRPCGGAIAVSPGSLNHYNVTTVCPGLLDKMIESTNIGLPKKPGDPVRFHFPTGRAEGSDGNRNTKGNFVLPWMFAFAVSRWFGVGFVTSTANGKGTWLEHLPTEIPPPSHRASDAAIAQLCSRCTSAATCTQPFYSGEAMSAIGEAVQAALRLALDGVDLGLAEGDVVVHDRCRDGDSVLLHAIYGPLPLSFYEAAPAGTKRFVVVGPPERHDSPMCRMVTQVMQAGLSSAAPAATIVEMPGNQVVDFARMVFAPKLMVGFSTFSLAAALANAGAVWTPLQWPPGLRGIDPNPPGATEKRLAADVWQIQREFLPADRWSVVDVTHLPGKRAARTELGLVCSAPLTLGGRACADADAKVKANAWLLNH